MEKRYGERVVYRPLTLGLERGERVAIVGRNGAGKTTLLKLIAGESAPDAGSVRFGHQVQTAYYAQHHTDLLDRDKTILEQIGALVPTESPTFVRGVLGSFLFSGDDVDKRIGVLSGGERARVALARLLVLPSNLLLMDEPTNHLDIDSAERLVEALQGYGGTLLFVSHNRSFIQQLATRIWDVRDGGIEEWPGSLDSYLHHLEQSGRSIGGGPDGDTARTDPAAASVESDRDRRRREAREREQRSAQLRPFRLEVELVERDIAARETERKDLEQQLADPATYEDAKRVRPLTERLHQCGTELEALYRRWETAQEQIEKLGG